MYSFTKDKFTEKVKTMDYPNFGVYLATKREERDITLREMARQLGVSAAFLSDVEKDRTAPLTKERLDKVAEVLNLNDTDKAEMYDLVGRQRNCVAPDIPEYIIKRQYVGAALRIARDLNAGEEEWKKFIEELRSRKG